MREVTTCFYDTCVPRDGDDEEESPSPVEKGERARLRVGGSHASLPFKDGVTRMVGVGTHHQPFGWSPALKKGGYDGGVGALRLVPLKRADIMMEWVPFGWSP